jgi:hypothetical protein
VISPDTQSLDKRWEVLQRESDPIKKEILFHRDRDRHLTKVVSLDLGPFNVRAVSVAQDQDPIMRPVRYAFRSFDRQWIPPDNRLLSMARPQLWSQLSDRQVFATAPEDVSPTSGPALTLTGLIPDQHHYHGRGGRAYPLWLDRAATEPNIKPELLTYLAKIYGQPVKAEDVMAYVAAVMAHPAFTARFAPDLVRPGLRIPITADAKLFTETVALGKEVIWLHCYGERFADPVANRPKQAPRLSKESAPTIPGGGMIPSAPEPLPDTMDYDPATRRLKIGMGYIENVTPEMWAYEVSGKRVLWNWFSYRRRDRGRPVIGDRRPPSPLDSIQPAGWLPEYTTELLDLLNVLGRLIALEPAQADLLNRVCVGPQRSAEELGAAAALATPEAASPKPKGKSKS